MTIGKSLFPPLFMKSRQKQFSFRSGKGLPHRFVNAYVLGRHMRSKTKKRTRWRRRRSLAGKHNFSKENQEVSPRPREYPQETCNHRVCGTKDSFPPGGHKVTQLFYFVQKILLSTFGWLRQAIYLTHPLIQYLSLLIFTKFLLSPVIRKELKNSKCLFSFPTLTIPQRKSDPPEE